MLYEIADANNELIIAGKKTQLPWWAALGTED